MLFARQKLQAEDQIRSASLRSASTIASAAKSASADEFLASLDATLVLDFTKDAQNTRAFELVNKTNQFNLNGRRWSDHEWRNMLDDSAQFVLTVSYTDRFGPLGRIAVVVGSFKGETLRISTWVMSCRAFSRRIEHAVLLQLIESFEPEQIQLDFKETERNSPTCQFLDELVGRDALHKAASFPSKTVKDKLSGLHHKVSIIGLEPVTSRQNAASVPR
jgi:FkbH-like protein